MATQTITPFHLHNLRKEEHIGCLLEVIAERSNEFSSANPDGSGISKAFFKKGDLLLIYKLENLDMLVKEHDLEVTVLTVLHDERTYFALALPPIYEEREAIYALHLTGTSALETREL